MQIVLCAKAKRLGRFLCKCVITEPSPDKESPMPSILFVCTANRFRSPLAAAMLRKRLEDMGIADSWSISSAGTWTTAGEPVMPGITVAAQRFNIDVSDHRSVRVSGKLLSIYDLIIVMQAGQKEALQTEFPHLEEHIYLLSDVVERRNYDIPDALGSEQEMAEVVAELHSLIERGVNSICVLATYLNNTKATSGC
jgi:protein-tyrosine phosphatase